MRAKFIFENPNAIIDPIVWQEKKDQLSYTPEKIEYDARGAIPFGFYGSSKKLVVGTRTMTHQHLLYKAKSQGLINTAGEFKERGRNSGRVFTDQKVISFWNFPKDYEELVNVIKELEKETKLNILNDPTWKIEIPGGEFKKAFDNDLGSWGSWHPRIGQVAYVSIDEYKGGYQRSDKELQQDHEKSPMLKKKKEPFDWGFGKLKGLDRLKSKYAMQSESFYPRLK